MIECNLTIVFPINGAPVGDCAVAFNYGGADFDGACPTEVFIAFIVGIIDVICNCLRQQQSVLKRSLLGGYWLDEKDNQG